MTSAGRHLAGKVLAVLAMAGGLLAVIGVLPAAAAQPTTVRPTLQPLCDGSTGSWTLHWLIDSTDDAPILVKVTLPGLKPGSSGSIPARQQGHIYVTNVPNGYQGGGQMSVSWADGSEPNSGNINVGPLGTCNKTVVTQPTLPTVTDPPSQPGTPTTVASGGRPTTTLAPTDPNNPSPSTSVLAQTNGAVVADPGADPGAVTSSTEPGASTDTSEAKVALAAGTTSSSSSSGSSGVVWIVLGIFVVAAAGGAVMLVMSRRSAPPGDDPAP